MDEHEEWDLILESLCRVTEEFFWRLQGVVHPKEHGLAVVAFSQQLVRHIGRDEGAHHLGRKTTLLVHRDHQKVCIGQRLF